MTKVSAEKKYGVENCQLCGRYETTLHTHHIIARADGGSDDDSNLIVICSDCHFKEHYPHKKDGDIEQFIGAYKEWMASNLFSEGYGLLPNRVARDTTISDFSKILYSELSSLSAERGYCWASNAYLAKIFNKSKGTISRSISELEKYLVIQNRLGSDRQIWVHSVGKKEGHLRKNDKVNIPKNEQQNSNTITIQDTISKDIVEPSQSKLPIKGNSSLQRIVNFYSSVWKERYGRYPVGTNYALLGKQLKPTLASVTEYQLALVVMQYFYWKGTTGSDEFGYKRLVDKAFPLHWLPTMVDEILVYWRNELGIDPDDEKEVKRVVDQKINELQIRTTP